jgi:hypothetical protein
MHKLYQLTEKGFSNFLFTVKLLIIIKITGGGEAG